jgi:hypothetical protein
MLRKLSFLSLRTDFFNKSQILYAINAEKKHFWAQNEFTTEPILIGGLEKKVFL